MILHAVGSRLRACFAVSNSHGSGADSITSTTSLIPFEQEELAKTLDLMDRLKGGLDEPFLRAKCIIACFIGISLRYVLYILLALFQTILTAWA
ncbi:uncharacterized protein BJ212DRAFT_1482495 [Suillus subaureus]|uniref:Uncharacterized protein n=1 Tax=Suillus subaureus TaxID=48587 RepID=A0A9P7E838_9AGAM|nr:uncharacterized protein BJ212DRAFT_1482495 [Suillus subaureus]KAG1813592.1 hypothetical protein BJ212DRAFT_1482495 [Suillus subaureus]